MKKNNPQPLIIKKYENRRLYNTLTSQYINQEQVAQLVRDGHELRVVDATTGEDVTRLVLAQIVVEDAKTPDSIFPLDVLRHMILASGRATQENALRYMKGMMDMYQNAYRALPPAVNPFEFLQGQWGQPGANRSSAEQPPQASPPVAATAVPGSEVDDLKRRIEELESLLTRRGPTKGKKKKLSQYGKLRRKS
jgi:polyhydroxyalkanoate synthesis repressor PhaR